MSGLDEIRAASERVISADARIKAALPQRGSEPGRAVWSAACTDFHEALRQFYSLVDLDEGLVRAGDRPAIDRAITLMEANPQCFRSGYLLADAAYALANAPLADVDRARLSAVVVEHVRRPRARMMRPIGRLASAVWSDELNDSLREIADSSVDLARLSPKTPRWGRHSRIEVRVACTRAAVEQQRRTDAGRAT